MGFTSIDLAQIKARGVGKCQVLSIARQGGGADRVFAGIRSQPTLRQRRSRRGSQRRPLAHKPPNTESNEYQGCGHSGDPPSATRMEPQNRGLRLDRSSRVMHRRQEAVPPAGDGLDKARILSAVSQCVSEPAHGRVETVVEVNKCVCGPQPALELFPRDHFSRPFQEQGKNLEGLLLQFYPGAVAS